jgi:hypothetical protein
VSFAIQENDIIEQNVVKELPLPHKEVKKKFFFLLKNDTIYGL